MWSATSSGAASRPTWIGEIRTSRFPRASSTTATPMGSWFQVKRTCMRSRPRTARLRCRLCRRPVRSPFREHGRITHMIALQRVRNERGIALVVVLLISLIVAVIAAGAALVASNTTLINSYTDRLSVLESAADAGIEEARSRINADKTLYPDSLYNTLESGALVKDNSGATIPGVTRSLYVGPTGISTGEYGVFGSVVSVVRDATGNTVVRRGEVVQESFSKYAYFTDKEGAIVFGGGDQIFGP